MELKKLIALAKLIAFYNINMNSNHVDINILIMKHLNDIIYIINFIFHLFIFILRLASLLFHFFYALYS